MKQVSISKNILKADLKIFFLTAQLLYIKRNFLPLRFDFITEVIAQLVRASVCGTEGRGFESH